MYDAGKWHVINRDDSYKSTVYNGSYHLNSKAKVDGGIVGSKVKFNFWGTKLRILSWGGTDGSGANVTIDGVDYGDFSTYNKNDKNNKLSGGSWLCFEKINLTQSQHSVVITTLDKKDISTESSGSYFSLDAIDIDADGKLMPFGEIRAILIITLKDSTEKKYDISRKELKSFLGWYDAKATGRGGAPYCALINKAADGKISNKDFIPFDEIRYFNVQEYKENLKS